MGVPKFFRYISERYPLCSQLVTESRISEFDNLYLDMNGIIHACTHNDDDPNMQISEEQMFSGIMRYIDNLFDVIQPQKIFYMAIDGVAPRAKMNQQRARRFKSKKEAQERAEQSRRKQPNEQVITDMFDSNCITPGTEMMARLSIYLKYYIARRLKEDMRWRKIKIIFSGYEVPGEGEHKIMAYIRSQRSLADYNPNTRHCLYGLDADLIMLGLLSHEPHFALLREEVQFGPKKQRSKQTTFYLMHLSIFREFLDIEFGSMRSQLPFEYDLERIIDDFILLAYFVGNDFLPSLPSMYIPNGSLAVMFQLYKRMLPQLGGYLNERGILNLGRVEAYLRELAENERTVFDSEMADKSWLRKRGAMMTASDILGSPADNSRVVLTASQKVIYDQIKSFFLHFTNADDVVVAVAKHLNTSPRPLHNELYFPASLSGRDRQFAMRVADEFCLMCELVGSGRDRNLLVWQDEQSVAPYMVSGYFSHILHKYDTALIRNDEFLDVDEVNREAYETAFADWKRNYYKTKLDIDPDNIQGLKAVRNSYVEGLQWVLHYYYNGVASWSWFYPYHYPPMISDLINLQEVPIHFDLGKPFRPFEQLLAVLPPASQLLVPMAFRPLLLDEYSPIKDFYPSQFKTDLNGKKNEWEAVVLVPFIDQKRLLNAMAPRMSLLTNEEHQRNNFGRDLCFFYDASKNYTFPAPFGDPAFPDVTQCPVTVEFWENVPPPANKGFAQGLLPNVRLGVDALAGFPSLHTLPFTAEMRMHGVHMFGTESKNENCVVTLTTPRQSAEQVAEAFVGRKCYVNWPFLVEALCVRVADNLFSFTRPHVPGRGRDKVQIVREPHEPHEVVSWERQADNIEIDHSKRGIVTGQVDVLLYVKPLKGLRRLENGSLVKDYDAFEQVVPSCAVVAKVKDEDTRYKEKSAPQLEDEVPIGASVIYLGASKYGYLAVVEGLSSIHKTVTISLQSTMQNAELASRLNFEEIDDMYYSTQDASKLVGLSPSLLSRLTGSLLVVPRSARLDEDGVPTNRVNLGLNIKFHTKGLRVEGYSRQRQNRWEYSSAALNLMQMYKAAFPAFFQNLSRLGSEQDTFLEEILFPTTPPTSQSIQAMRHWLKEKGVDALPKLPVTSQHLSANETAQVVAIIDARLRAVAAAEKTQPKQTRLVKDLPPGMVLTPELAPFRLGNQLFSLGDRVRVCIWSASTPFGSWATVIGLDLPKVEILLDEASTNATTLDGRCPPNRGLVLDAFALLNISSPQPPIGATMKAADNGKPKPDASRAKSPLPKTATPQKAHSKPSTSPAPIPIVGKVTILKRNNTDNVATYAKAAVSTSSQPPPPPPPQTQHESASLTSATAAITLTPAVPALVSAPPPSVIPSFAPKSTTSTTNNTNTNTTNTTTTNNNNNNNNTDTPTTPAKTSDWQKVLFGSAPTDMPVLPPPTFSGGVLGTPYLPQPFYPTPTFYQSSYQPYNNQFLQTSPQPKQSQAGNPFVPLQVQRRTKATKADDAQQAPPPSTTNPNVELLLPSMQWAGSS